MLCLAVAAKERAVRKKAWLIRNSYATFPHPRTDLTFVFFHA